MKELRNKKRGTFGTDVDQVNALGFDIVKRTVDVLDLLQLHATQSMEKKRMKRIFTVRVCWVWGEPPHHRESREGCAIGYRLANRFPNFPSSVLAD